jgi:hypothetical protein
MPSMSLSIPEIFSVPHKDCICRQGNKHFEDGDIYLYIYASRDGTDDGFFGTDESDNRAE